MKIKEIRAVEIVLNPKPTTPPRTPSRAGTFPMNRPVSRYAAADRRGEHVSGSGWNRPACIVTAEDGTWGFGISLYSGPVSSYHQRPLCPASRRRKLHGDRENVGFNGAILRCLWCNRFDELRHQCG